MASTAWSKGSVKDVAESIGIAGLSDEVSGALAADVEYRLREVIEESLKFARHAKRTRLKVEDIDYALKARNIEPLWGFASPHTPISYRKVPHSSGNLYVLEDEEIDLSKLIQSELPPIPREVTYTAHWLAVEGVQPAIPQNPSPADLRTAAANARSAGRSLALGPEGTEVKPLVAHALPRELQLYFDRLTSAAVDADETTRLAALESFRGDTGLQGLVAYLVQWVAERVVASLASSLTTLDQCLDILEAMLQNPSLFSEPYLHQILPCVLSILLTSTLGPPVTQTQNAQSTHAATRQHAASFLAFILNRYSHTYSALKPRAMQTILRGLVNGCLPDGKHSGTLLGSLMGIRALGNDSVRRIFGAQSTNLAKVGEALQRNNFSEADREACTNTVLEALQDAYPPSSEHSMFDYHELEQYAGSYFAAYINSQCSASVAAGIVTEPSSEEQAEIDAIPSVNGISNGLQRPSLRHAESHSTDRDQSQDAEASGESDDDASEDVEME
ncbi:TAF-domain-containing protein [Cystobasidium minutum MCA 4210]|uniref:TAF-domain-containing protein n=1 Tax=Cystobasidium minutum MCA 4210 TaxID=1397322 RepID=UPI0034CF866B|eukprot:jgi/Rhomi1/173739/fgenesh1_kg.6_\